MSSSGLTKTTTKHLSCKTTLINTEFSSKALSIYTKASKCKLECMFKAKMAKSLMNTVRSKGLCLNNSGWMIWKMWLAWMILHIHYSSWLTGTEFLSSFKKVNNIIYLSLLIVILSECSGSGDEVMKCQSKGLSHYRIFWTKFMFGN